MKKKTAKYHICRKCKKRIKHFKKQKTNMRKKQVPLESLIDSAIKRLSFLAEINHNGRNNTEIRQLQDSLRYNL